jgi:5'-nucleotidase
MRRQRGLKEIALRILITNDDGIHAPGLAVAEKIARALSDDVWVFAPENEQSGASHSLTLSVPLRLREVSPRRYAVAGTPTDCVMLAALHVLKDKVPQLVLSGVNAGSNLADDVTYSGTIAGAMEGCALGFPSIALSQAGAEDGEIDWSVAQTHGADVVRRVLKAGWPPGTLVNINFPACAAEAVKGVTVAPQGAYDISSTSIEARADVRRRPYYWIGLRQRDGEVDRDTDLGAVQAGKIAVTPLHLNLTQWEVLEKMRSALAKG